MTTLPIQQQTLVQRLWKVVGINVVRPWGFGPATCNHDRPVSGDRHPFLANDRLCSSGRPAMVFPPEFFLIIFLFVTANQPFITIRRSLSFGISRSDFYFGSLLNFALQSFGMPWSACLLPRSLGLFLK